MNSKLAFEGLSNMRDLGGMATADGRLVREGVLYRSDQLYFATEADRAQLAERNIALVVDFRSVPERDEKPDPAIGAARYVHLPVIQDVRAGITRDENSNKRMIETIIGDQAADPESIGSYMYGMYRAFVEGEHARKQYAQFIDEVLKCLRASGAALWHCTAGKDRGGFATVVLLEALGVKRDEIYADYLKTNTSLEGVTAQLISMFSNQLAQMGHRTLEPDALAEAKTALERFFCADKAFLAGAYDAADDTFGGFDAFLEQGLGINDAKRTELKELCLAG